ncbi:hypothetical protein GCM10010466_41420 [Planomonospora alba]|uniref:Uncharacterized protein n=1 Tax=Planomonospora alba TaxID=161354 RepID=A0ABP6NGT3_9ACTN
MILRDVRRVRGKETGGHSPGFRPWNAPACPMDFRPLLCRSPKYGFLACAVSYRGGGPECDRGERDMEWTLGVPRVLHGIRTPSVPGVAMRRDAARLSRSERLPGLRCEPWPP